MPRAATGVAKGEGKQRRVDRAGGIQKTGGKAEEDGELGTGWETDGRKGQRFIGGREAAVTVSHSLRPREHIPRDTCGRQALSIAQKIEGGQALSNTMQMHPYEDCRFILAALIRDGTTVFEVRSSRKHTRHTGATCIQRD